ncbi:ComEA family DNA-binding protein [Dorea sp. OM02-2LB]|nr:ComEA family DNA-binding protein [Dorea sp. OM02-2LB]
MGADARMKKENRTLYKKQDRTGRKIGWILLVVLLAMSGCVSEKKNRADGLTEVEFSTEDDGKASEKENDRISEEEAADADGRNSSKGVSDSGQPESDGMSQNEIRVYICGQICNPGVYTLEEDSRICDVIQKAGGLKQEASETYLNQAQRLEDGMKIYVPSKEEAKTLGDPAQELSGISGQVTGGAGDSTENGTTQGKVNINRADKAELMTLTGIGETKAEAILSYRETNRGFQSLEELKQVEGIKDGTFQKIKDQICL